MSFVESIRPHIPYLRRYARILTGSQEEGDSRVRACLQAAVDGAAELETDLSPHLALFRLFHATWSVQLEAPDISDTPRALSRVAPVARQVLLLTSVEGFSIEDTAIILRMDLDETKQQLVRAQADLNASLATNVMIIEDEPVIALDLQAIVERQGHKVTGVARTHEEATKLAAEMRPNLVLADIQLADGSSGIDAVRDILKENICPVIFITAYPERLLTGEKPEPTYLITKPFMPETVSATISQALFFADENAAATV